MKLSRWAKVSDRMKDTGASWRAHLSVVIQDQLGYKSTKADPDMYMKPKRDVQGQEYYAYLIVYVDDLLSIDIHPERAINQKGEIF